MLVKLLFSCITTLLFLEMFNTLEAQDNYKNTLINKFCIASLKSKLNLQDIQKERDISRFTCECFYNKYKSGSSIKNSRIYCKNKAAEKYSL